MDPGRLKTWERLFGRALKLIDSVAHVTVELEDWSLGGGTVLMHKFRHRYSKDIDIFIPDPQYLNYLTARLNDIAISGTRDYIERSNTLKLVYPNDGKKAPAFDGKKAPAFAPGMNCRP